MPRIELGAAGSGSSNATFVQCRPLQFKYFVTVSSPCGETVLRFKWARVGRQIEVFLIFLHLARPLQTFDNATATYF